MQQHWLVRHSLGDWLTTLVILSIGLYLDRQPPFEQYIGNRLTDPTISYPHTPKERQQVTATQLIYISLLLPACVIAAYQLVLHRSRRRGDLNQALLGLLSSLAVALTLVCIVKNAVGRLRPDFLARCKPLNGVCSQTGPEVIEGRKSFPSGHSTLSMAGLAYLSIYLGAKLGHMQGGAVFGNFWKIVAASTPWLFALWVGLSRLEDYWHHWEDIAVGLTLGNACAFAMYRLRYPSPFHGSEPHTATASSRQSTSGKAKDSPPGESEDAETEPLACQFPI